MAHAHRIVRGALLVTALFGLGACSPSTGSPSPTAEEGVRRAVEDQHTPRAADARSVAGQWDVVSFEGYRPARLIGTGRAAYADFGSGGVSLRMECNYTGRPGAVRDGRFALGDDSNSVQTSMGCGPERGSREARFFGFFEQAPTIETLGPDRLRLRAGASELLLERPAVRRLSNLPSRAELDGAWRMMDITRYLPEGGVSGTGLSEIPGQLIIAGDRLYFSACPEQGLSVRYAPEGRLVKTDGPAPASGPLGCPGVSDVADAPILPSASEALRLLHADPLVEKSGEGLLLSTERHGLLIVRDDR